MDSFDKLGDRMKVAEASYDSSIPESYWIVVRVDGRAFHRFTETFEKPVCERFSFSMVNVAETLMMELNGDFAFTQSDEISILFRPSWCLFGRRTQKIISISAAIASAKMTQLYGQSAQFDSRIIAFGNEQNILDYFDWRTKDAQRNSLNSFCFWTLVQKGISRKEATKRLNGLWPEQKLKLLKDLAIDYPNLPAWKRNGMYSIWRHTPRRV